MSRSRLAAVAWALLISLGACGERDQQPVAAPAPSTPERTVEFDVDPELEGLRIVLSEGSPTGGGQERLPAVATRPLDAATTSTLLSRLPPMAEEADGQAEFRKRADSRPAPRPGMEVDVAFPPPVPDLSAPTTTGGPLQVLRASPEGDIPLAPHLSLSFDQPMVAVTSQDAAAAQVPVRLVPQPPGQWRWLGTRTLVFEPTGRFPMATDYLVEVPQGTRSAVGGSLDATFRQSFRTPPPSVVLQVPTGGPVQRQPVILLGFDQAVDPDAVQGRLRVEARDAAVPVRRARPEEIAADEALKAAVTQLDERGAGRWLAVVPQSPLPYDATVSVTVPAGTPSAEGPRTTAVDQASSFRTYGPFELLESNCGYRDQCRPSDAIQLRFSNPIDAEAFDLEQVRIEPEIPDAQIYASGTWLQVHGQKVPLTTYTVTVATTLKDGFGQSLAAPVVVKKKTGPAEAVEPWVYAPSPELMVLDPLASPSWAVYSMGLSELRLRVMRVAPSDFAAFRDWRSQPGWWDPKQKLGPPPGQALADQRIAVSGPLEEQVETRIDLEQWLGQGPGQLLVWVEPPRQHNEWNRMGVVAWVQRTNIGLTTWADATDLVAWATDLGSGAPLPGVQVQLGLEGPTATSGPDGLARIALPGDSPGSLVLARSGPDLAFQEAGFPSWRREESDSLAWFVFDDRQMYKPGEQVRIKGWVRRIVRHKGGDVEAADAAISQGLRWVLRDPRGGEVAQGKASFTALGGFDLALDLPDDVNLGTAWVELAVQGGPLEPYGSSHAFQIQEFRRPEYEVKASVEPGPHVLGEVALASVSAAYYAGGGLPGAEVRWDLQPSWGDYRPPNQEGWTFGPWVPWWMHRGWMPEPPALEAPAPFASTTDSLGQHHLAMHFAALGTPRPVQVTATASVTDVNRQTWAASTSLLVHPSSVYVGLKTARPFTDGQDPIEVQAMAVDLDGRPVVGRPIALRFWTTRWTPDKKGEWKEVEEHVQTCTVDSKGPKPGQEFEAQPVSCRFQPQGGGRWSIRATVQDELGRDNQSELAVWVSGASGDQPRDRRLSQEEVTLVPDQERYQPGDTAEILVQSPFGPAQGVLTLRRSGLVEARPFTMTTDSIVLTVPLLDAHVPNLELQVDLVGSAPRLDDAGQPRPDLPRRPAYASGSLDLQIPPVQRTLQVQAQLGAASVDPGGSTSLSVLVTDADGRPVPGAELAIVVVDESVLALTGYRIADPLAAFYVQRGGEVSVDHLRSLVWLGDPGRLPQAGPGGATGGAVPEMAPAMELRMMEGAMPPPSPSAAVPRMDKNREADGGGDREEASADASGPAIALRSDLRALALFLPAETTGADGRRSVEVKVPDNLTRYRVTVVAVEGARRFGSAESSLTARKPLMLRPSAPRFLNFGDRFELPLVVQNQTDQAMTVNLAAQAGNARFVDDAWGPVPSPEAAQALPRQAGLQFEVPANDRVEVRVPTTALMAGTARFQVAIQGRVAGGGKEATDAASFELPVWTPATSEAFATYGEIGGLPPQGGPAGGDPDAILQPVQAPADVWPQFGGLELTTSSTAVQALTDAVLYLVAYPYECAEQRASRVLSVAALKDVLGAFEAPGLPPPDELQAAMARDIEELARMQRPDGGWGFWQGDRQSWPYVSLHVAHALARAQAKGFPVPERTRTRALAYLRDIRRHTPADTPLSVKQALQAYALYVRRLMGDSDKADALALFREAGIGDVRKEGLSLESLGWILPVLHEGHHETEVAAILRHLENRVSETASSAQFTSGYGEGDWLLLYSDRRTDAVLLEALIAVQARHDLVPKLVQGLLDHRVAGRWGNTQENAFVLLALDRYFAVYESETPDFVARTWLGPDYVGEQRFQGRTTEHATLRIPMQTVMDAAGTDAAPLVLQRDGKGRMYYRIGLRYAPRDLDLAPADRGFVVLREYAAVDDATDVRREADGSWWVKAGARVRVKLTMVADARRSHVALVDPLPAGLEPINPALAVSEPVPAEAQAQADLPPWARGGGYWWWWRPWYEHQNMRDERVEAFASQVWAGVHEYSYVARATTPGSFVVPPARAEEMYHPETFGRTGTDRLVVGP